jgi:hypothetical protein
VTHDSPDYHTAEAYAHAKRPPPPAASPIARYDSLLSKEKAYALGGEKGQRLLPTRMGYLCQVSQARRLMIERRSVRARP